MLISVVQEAKKCISKDQVEKKVALAVSALKEQINNLRGAVMIAYPAYHGLPEWEPVRLVLENQIDFAHRGDEYLVEKDTSLWWAGKELLRGKLLRD